MKIDVYVYTDTGTIADPYMIYTYEDFWLMKYGMSVHYKWANDLDMVNIDHKHLLFCGQIHCGDLQTNSFMSVSNRYFYVEVAQAPHSAYGKLTWAMKFQSNFHNWKFNTVWGIEEGVIYPYLRKLPNPFDNIVPPEPTETPVLKLVSKTTDCVTLRWTTITGADCYALVYNGNTLTPLGNQITATGLTANTPYSFRVLAVKGSEYSDWSNTVTVTTDTVPSLDLDMT